MTPKRVSFRWVKRISIRIKIGKTAGHRAARSRYITIRIDGVLYMAHRLAWLQVHGRWPDKQIDHVNGDRSDNRLANLREATGSQNLWNSQIGPRNRSGIKGVFWNKGAKKWTAKIMAHYKMHYLGDFKTKEDAARAYETASRELHGDFSRPS